MAIHSVRNFVNWDEEDAQTTNYANHAKKLSTANSHQSDVKCLALMMTRRCNCPLAVIPFYANDAKKLSTATSQM